jgi:hypothetical protein
MVKVTMVKVAMVEVVRPGTLCAAAAARATAFMRPRFLRSGAQPERRRQDEADAWGQRPDFPSSLRAWLMTL